jgi:hypothetical protein
VIPNNPLQVNYLDDKAADVVPTNYFIIKRDEPVVKDKVFSWVCPECKGINEPITIVVPSIQLCNKCGKSVALTKDCVITKPSKEMASLPPPKFELGQMAKVQGQHRGSDGQSLEHNGQVKIIGQEWGCFWQGQDIKARNKEDGWLYLVTEIGDWSPLCSLKRFYISEDDLMKWNPK